MESSLETAAYSMDVVAVLRVPPHLQYALAHFQQPLTYKGQAFQIVLAQAALFLMLENL